jgi:hypothetical protein
MSTAVTLDDQIAAAKRELRMREHVYPRWKAALKMTPAKAEQELAAMRAIVETLERVRVTERPGLF